MEGCFRARFLDADDFAEMAPAYRLRHEYFVRLKEWVSPNETHSELEYDEYDAYAKHVAVVHNETIVSYLRVIDQQAPCGFMLSHEFKALLPGENRLLLQERDSIEISRLVVASQVRRKDVKTVLSLLFKALYQLSIQRDYRTFLIVIEPQWLLLFARRFGFQFAPLGPVKRFPDGTMAVAACAKVRDLEMALGTVNPAALEWYRNL